MKKIPTVFLRDPEDMSKLTHEVNPLAQWVIDGEGIPTRKYDGTCVMYDGYRWWARREVKEGKAEPPNWIELDIDPITGKRVGWEPIEQSGYRKQLLDALKYDEAHEFLRVKGTYELCGPKVGNNFERLSSHRLFLHAKATPLDLNGLLTHTSNSSTPIYYAYENMMKWFSEFGWEGLVWHHPDGRMAKLKVRDFQIRGGRPNHDKGVF